jgi:hypothetical protein
MLSSTFSLASGNSFPDYGDGTIQALVVGQFVLQLLGMLA